MIFLDFFTNNIKDGGRINSGGAKAMSDNTNGALTGESIEKKTKKKRAYDILLAISGFFVGIFNGLFGGGGGMVVVPAFTSLAGLDEKKAHATAIATILPLSVVSAIVYIAGGNFDFGIGLNVTAGVIIGGVIGAVLLKKISNGLLSLAFYGIMIAAGVKMLI